MNNDLSEHFEILEWQESDSTDSFDTWKQKQEESISSIIGIAVVIGLLFGLGILF